MKAKSIYIAIILVFYLLLPILILVGILDFSHKFIHLTFGAAAIYAILKSLNVGNSEMGIPTKSSLKSVKMYQNLPLLFLLWVRACIFLASENVSIQPKQSIFICFIFLFHRQFKNFYIEAPC